MKITEITESINFYDRFGHDTGAQALPYTVEVRDRETGGKKLISIQAVSAADARERARDRGYRVVRVVSQDDSQDRKSVREHDGRDDEPEETDDDGRTMADRARRDGRGGDDEPETAAQRRRRSLQATRDFNRGRRADGMREGAPELLKAEMPLVRHIERELAQHGYEKGTEEYKKMFDYALSYYRKFGNVDAIKKGVAEGEKKPHPQTWHDVDKKLGRAVDKMSQAEKVKKGLAHPDTLKKKGVAEGIMDTIKGAAKELTRDSLQKKIKQAWENTFWPKHIEPALNRIQINGQPFRRMVLGEPRVIENDRSKNAILKQYTVNIVFPIDPKQWAGDEIRYLEGQLRDIEDGDWNPKVHGLGLVSFDQPMKSFQYTKGPVPDLVIPVRITSLDINRSLVGEQGVAEGDVIKGPWSGMNKPEPGERYAIVRTKPDGTRDFAAGHFDSWQKAKQELQKFLKHELHTELGHQFEIVKKKQSVAEGHADQQRTIVKRNGQPVGEIGIDRESSPGAGQYYMKHYASGTDLSGYGSREEAMDELKHYLKQGVSER